MKFPAAPFPAAPLPVDDAALSILSGSSLVKLILHLVVSCDLTTPAWAHHEINSSSCVRSAPRGPITLPPCRAKPTSRTHIGRFQPSPAVPWLYAFFIAISCSFPVSGRSDHGVRFCAAVTILNSGVTLLSAGRFVFQSAISRSVIAASCGAPKSE
eukprot:7385214-Prymnesium_polylepis.1